MWREKFSALNYCDELEFRALEALGDAEKALSKARLLWNHNPYDSKTAWVYLSRLKGKVGCTEFVQAFDEFGKVIRFSEGDEIRLRKKHLDCLITKNYRNALRSA